MYKKITIVLTLLFTAALVFLAYKYYQAQDYKLIANEKINYLNQAADNFYTYGLIICIASWLWVNIAAFKTKQLFWLWIPFLFVCFVAYKMSYHAEDIFIFNKQNGMWKGGFSISYLVSIVLVLISIVVLCINFFILKNVTKKMPH
ncbi:MAG: hypothetical protein KA319_04885 [Ferruginibacter sp.]|nr:hypothetical protein [Ferruginibacter sp.]